MIKMAQRNSETGSVDSVVAPPPGLGGDSVAPTKPTLSRSNSGASEESMKRKDRKKTYYVESARRKLVTIRVRETANLFQVGDVMEIVFQQDEWYIGRHLEKETEHVFPAVQCDIIWSGRNASDNCNKKFTVVEHAKDKIDELKAQTLLPWQYREKIKAAKAHHDASTWRAEAGMSSTGINSSYAPDPNNFVYSSPADWHYGPPPNHSSMYSAAREHADRVRHALYTSGGYGQVEHEQLYATESDDVDISEEMVKQLHLSEPQLGAAGKQEAFHRAFTDLGEYQYSADRSVDPVEDLQYHANSDHHRSVSSGEKSTDREATMEEANPVYYPTAASLQSVHDPFEKRSTLQEFIEKQRTSQNEPEMVGYHELIRGGAKKADGGASSAASAAAGPAGMMSMASPSPQVVQLQQMQQMQQMQQQMAQQQMQQPAELHALQMHHAAMQHAALQQAMMKHQEDQLQRWSGNYPAGISQPMPQVMAVMAGMPQAVQMGAASAYPAPVPTAAPGAPGKKIDYGKFAAFSAAAAGSGQRSEHGSSSQRSARRPQMPRAPASAGNLHTNSIEPKSSAGEEEMKADSAVKAPLNDTELQPFIESMQNNVVATIPWSEKLANWRTSFQGLCETRTNEFGVPFIPSAEVVRDAPGAKKKKKPLLGPKYLCTFLVQIEDDDAFCVAKRIIGPSGRHMLNIWSIVPSAKVRLRGRGSGFKEHDTGEEADEALRLNISVQSKEGYELVKHLVSCLLKDIYEEHARFTKQPKHSIKLLEHPANPKLKDESRLTAFMEHPFFRVANVYQCSRICDLDQHLRTPR